MADMHINSNKGWQFRWTAEEDKILKTHYPQNGYLKVQELLPNRNKRAIRSRASKLGIKYLSYDNAYFDNIDSPTKAYWLGFLYADGYVTTNNRWGLELQLSDSNHLKHLLEELKYNGEMKTRIKNGNSSCYVLINNANMHDSLVKNGVIMNKTNALSFPDETILPIEYTNCFIRGFYDGDGCVSYSDISKEISFVCKSNDFIMKLLSIFKNNDISFSYSINARDNLPTLRLYKKEEIQKFYTYIYSNSNENNRLERKYIKIKHLLSSYKKEVV